MSGFESGALGYTSRQDSPRGRWERTRARAAPAPPSEWTNQVPQHTSVGGGPLPVGSRCECRPALGHRLNSPTRSCANAASARRPPCACQNRAPGAGRRSRMGGLSVAVVWGLPEQHAAGVATTSHNDPHRKHDRAPQPKQAAERKMPPRTRLVAHAGGPTPAWVGTTPTADCRQYLWALGPSDWIESAHSLRWREIASILGGACCVRNITIWAFHYSTRV